ncbi:MAG TPA: hypothetical protein VGH28_15675 [Polyangiaceae bacterium]|jgi:hypothetical protein
MRGRLAARVFVFVSASAGLLRCGSCKSSAATDAAPSAAASAAPAIPGAPLSLPINADHDSDGNVYVAGFVAARGAVVVARYESSGRLDWNADAFGSLGWSSDAHVDVVGATGGAVVVWRGIQNGKRTRTAVWVSRDGKVGAPFAVGAGACAAASTLVSIGGNGSAIKAHPLPEGTEKKVVTLPEGRDATLVCGTTKRAFVIDEGEDDIGVRAIEDGVARPRALLVGPDDLGDDEIREHEDFTMGDVLGQMLLTEAGHLVLREYAESPTARRPLDAVVAPDEDLMAVDGNATHVVAIVSREASARCDGDIGTDVLAVDVPLPSGHERTLEVARGACGHDLGPYWVAPTESAAYVAWAVRGPRSGDHAPLEALAWAKLDAPSQEVKLSAETVVFAGCAKEKCTFVALERPEGTDGMVPGAAKLITIP